MKNFNLLKSVFDQYVDFEPDEWKSYRDLSVVRNFKKGDIITKAGEVENYLNFVTEGLGRVFVLSKEGKEYTIQFGFAGDFLSSYASFISQTPSQTSLQALSSLEMISIHKDNLEALYQKSKSGERMGRLSAEGLYIWKEHREIELLTKSAKERYLALLHKNPNLVLTISQKHLASYLGVTPESLSRLKKEVVLDKSL
jgi:CRP-like cAMP-binding protein